MAPIDRDKIDELIQTVDIVDVIGEYVSLHPSGKNMKGLCPFHSEKTPSFFVSKEKQIYKCFGCDAKGNAITFIENYKHLDFIESVRYLADQYHYDLGESVQDRSRNNYTRLYEVNKLARDFFNLNLLNLDSGQKALSYLESRMLSKQVLNQYHIGYAPTRNELLSNLKENFQEFEMIEAGLIQRNELGEYFDAFRDRIMIPIHNEQGKVIGFSGRLLSNDKNQPKYINTQTSKIFNKSDTLYNLDQALPFINQRKRVVLMEGFFDVIQASLAGVEESVCTMGTELTLDQASKLKKYTDHIVICYDGDSAGKKATYRAISALEKLNFKVEIALMPEGLDPDEYIKKYSKSHFRNQLNQHLLDKFDFVYQMIIEKGLETPSDIEVAKTNLFKFLVDSASKTITQIYLQKFSEEINLPFEIIDADYKKFLVEQNRFERIDKQRPKLDLPKISKARESAEIKLINYYLQSDTYRSIVENEFGLFHFSKGFRLIIFDAMRELYLANREVALYTLKTDLSKDAYEYLEDFLLNDHYQYSEHELKDLIETLVIHTNEEEIVELRNQMIFQIKQKDSTENADNEEVIVLMSRIKELNKINEQIKRRRHGK